ncbi:hypothetical protein [Streptomyces sp. NRRL WC-3742]|uniref:hypothetical protein n=1 Tax=Streptomyces sp. NRRL WC-3742 TaxID=1463934 RepID=UPI0004C84AA3|nr:hypothetical protein [Streptomyces sp. NRRL WC-3742]
MAYRLTFFCRSGEENGLEALDRLLDELLSAGAPLLAEGRGPFVDEVAAYALGTGGSADRLELEVQVGTAWIAESVIEASPDDAHGIWGCDLLATITLSGDSPDWPLVDRIWTALVDLWGAVAWDEASGFAVGAVEPCTGSRPS